MSEETARIVVKVDSGRYCAVIRKKKFNSGYRYRGVIMKNGSEKSDRLTTGWCSSIELVKEEFRHIARSVLAKF